MSPCQTVNMFVWHLMQFLHDTYIFSLIWFIGMRELTKSIKQTLEKLTTVQLSSRVEMPIEVVVSSPDLYNQYDNI